MVFQGVRISGFWGVEFGAFVCKALEHRGLVTNIVQYLLRAGIRYAQGQLA